MKEGKKLAIVASVLSFMVVAVVLFLVAGRMYTASERRVAQVVQVAPSREELIAKINELLTILYALLARQQTCVDISLNLFPGVTDISSNSQVSKLQKFLISVGDLGAVVPSGMYDSATVAAVQKFQARQGILTYGSVATNGFGSVGPRTRAAVRTVSCSMSSRVRSGYISRPPEALTATTTPPNLGVCSDGLDNDSDDMTDWPIDPGCSALSDQNESNSSADDFYVVSWEPSASDSENIVPVYWIGRGSDGSFVSPNPVEAAREMSRREDLGMLRVMQDWDGDSNDFGLFDLLGDSNPADNCTTSQGESFSCIWWDSTVDSTRDRYVDFFTTFESNGGDLDYFFTDFEKGFSNWTIGSVWPSDVVARRWAAIQSDPRFLAERLASRLGFSDLSTVHNWSHNGNNFSIWNSVMNERVAAYLNDATYDVISDFYPQVKMANFGYMSVAQRYSLRDFHGHDISVRDQIDSIAGTHQQPILFGSLGQIANVRMDGVNLYSATPFNALRLDQNTLRVAKLSNENVPLAPAFAYKGFDGLNSRFARSDFYQENLIHAALVGSEVLYYWNPYSTWLLQGQRRANRYEEDKMFSDTVKEFERVVNFSDKRSLISDDNDGNQYEINELIGWSTDYILTGIETGGRRVWRFTPNDADMVSPSARIISIPGSNILELQTNQGVLSFSEATVWVPQNPVTPAPNGLWIIQPIDATVSF